ncbi:Pol protein [Elysia marginata]|uniref:Pol protein n=1 Tax=Elysia marginata TaxID=1093978 RepID=A0AAV4I5Q8_9GAST|nr:Pol protein [Elysia marginata]
MDRYLLRSGSSKRWTTRQYRQDVPPQYHQSELETRKNLKSLEKCPHCSNLKKDKDPKELKSYRPISLTSCMGKEVRCNKALYADGLVIWHTHRYARQSARYINLDLEPYQKYCDTWKITISTSNKTSYSVFTLSSKVTKQNLNIRLSDQQLKKEEHPNYLGVQLDPRLNLKNTCSKPQKEDHEKTVSDQTPRQHLMGIRYGHPEISLPGLYGSVFKATVNAGYGVYTCFQDGTSREIYGACEETCSNYEAEAIGIQSALGLLNTTPNKYPTAKKNAVIFFDS